MHFRLLLVTVAIHLKVNESICDSGELRPFFVSSFNPFSRFLCWRARELRKSFVGWKFESLSQYISLSLFLAHLIMKNACEECFGWVENRILHGFPWDQPNIRNLRAFYYVFSFWVKVTTIEIKIESFVTVLADVSYSLFDLIYIKTSSSRILN